MSGITKTPHGTFQVRWRASGIQKKRTFKRKAEATAFLRALNSTPSETAGRVTLADVLTEYMEHETPKKRGQRSERLRLEALMKRPIARLKMDAVNQQTVQSYIDRRLQEPSHMSGTISDNTVIREVRTLSAVCNWAVKHGMATVNPCLGVSLPREPQPRERTASDEERAKLRHVVGWDGASRPATASQLVVAAFEFSCLTGMRVGEILKMEPAWLDGAVVHLPAEATKTGARRDVALSSKARSLIKLVGPSLWRGLNPRSREALWHRTVEAAGLGPITDSQGRIVKEGLHFHDARATFATWAASPDPKTGAPRLDLFALARQTGHRSLKMLQRYYRTPASEIARRLG